MPDHTLTDLRQRIDDLDVQLVDLLGQRAATAQAIGAAKKGGPVYRPAREQQVLSNITAANDGPLTTEVLQGIYREIIAACRNLQRPLCVAYLGPAGTYSEEAARRHCGASSCYLPCDSIDDAFRAVETGRADVAVVPAQNSTAGPVAATTTGMRQHSLAVCAELSLPIRHQLLTRAKELADITEVLAHPQALAQCRAWLREHLPHAIQTPAASNAAAAIRARKQSHLAAIASRRAGELYKLSVLAADVQDDPVNSTRFVVLAKPESSSSAPVALPYVCDLAPYQPGLPIAEVARQYGHPVEGIIKLASNENPRGPSPKVRQAIAQAAKETHRYPEQYGLLQALARQLDVRADMLVLGNGSNDVLDLIARAYLAPGTEAVSSQYGFAMYQLVTQAVGAANRVVPAKDCGHDLSAMLAAITPVTKVLWIANPNNPTGTFVPYAEVKRFVAQVPPDVLVVLDEAYYEYLDDADRADTTRWLAQHPNLVLVRTFSKAYGLAGLRLGYAVANPAVAEILNRIRQPFNGNGVALAAAEAALADQTYIAKSRAANRRGRNQLLRGLQKLDLECLPAHGNFVTCKLPDAAMVHEQLLQRGIIVRPLAGYGLPDWLRITVGLSAENTRLLEALAVLHRA